MGSVEGISFGTEIHPVGNLISLGESPIAVTVDIRCIKSQHQVRAFQQITQYIFHPVSCFPLGAGGIRIPRKGIDFYSCNADFGTEDMLTGVENQFDVLIFPRPFQPIDCGYRIGGLDADTRGQDGR